MAGELRRSTRLTKFRQDQSFLYDDDSIRFLTNSRDVSNNSQLQHHLSEIVVHSAISEEASSSCYRGVAPLLSTSSWLNLYSSPHLLGLVSEEAGQAFCESAVKRRVSQGSTTSDECSDTPVVNTSLGKKGHARHCSSTRENILDFSVDSGSQARFNTSGMDNSDTEV